MWKQVRKLHLQYDIYDRISKIQFEFNSFRFDSIGSRGRIVMYIKQFYTCIPLAHNMDKNKYIYIQR